MTGDPKAQPVVLVIESPESASPALSHTLETQGYTVWQATTGVDARKMLAEARRAGIEPDAIVIGHGLADVDGRVLSAFLRADMDAPIVLCAPLTAATERAVGYHVGVDSYLCSPVDPFELDALLQSLLRRSGVRELESSEPETRTEELRVGPLVIHEQKRSVSIDAQPVALTPTQFRLLVSLAKQPNVLVPLSELTQTVWKCEPDDGATSLIATQVARLRARLREGSSSPPSIVSVPSRGYRLLAA